MSTADQTIPSINQLAMRLYGWIAVRPRRWMFKRMVCNTNLRLLPEKSWDGIRLPNAHWWILYRTVFKFFKWLNYDAWRPFCDWTGGYRRTYPLIARVIHRMGATTAGYSISGGECFHCGSTEGDPVNLSDDETGTVFILEGTDSVATMDGTDHRFWGTTICPKCGYRQHFEDGSL